MGYGAVHRILVLNGVDERVRFGSKTMEWGATRRVRALAMAELPEGVALTVIRTRR
jgi:hypothetical protein